MRIILNFRKNVNENAAAYYERAKKARAKAEGARKAIAETERKLASLEKKIAEKTAATKLQIKIKREKEWFEKFHYFTTSGGFLVLAGRDAKQNELLVARHMEPNDLFMHADVHGAPATIIKNGQNAGEKDLQEAAQFSASYSSAWKSGLGACDVYAVKPEQVSKHSHGEFVPKGGFVIKGERQWFRNARLGLVTGIVDNVPASAPAGAAFAATKMVTITPGGEKEKGEVAKIIAKRLGCDIDELMQVLPNGKSKIAAG